MPSTEVSVLKYYPIVYTDNAIDLFFFFVHQLQSNVHSPPSVTILIYVFLNKQLFRKYIVFTMHIDTFKCDTSSNLKPTVTDD